MVEVRVIKKDGMASVEIPLDMLERLGGRDVAVVWATETPNGIELTPSNSAFAKQMIIAERVMHERDDVLRRLAD